LCKHFRQAAGQTPAAWRRAHRSHHDENGTPPVEAFTSALRNSTPSNAATQPASSNRNARAPGLLRITQRSRAGSDGVHNSRAIEY
jgi:hypothetical protein